MNLAASGIHLKFRAGVANSTSDASFGNSGSPRHLRRCRDSQRWTTEAACSVGGREGRERRDRSQEVFGLTGSQADRRMPAEA